MESILYLAHTEEDGSLSKAALEGLTVATTLVGTTGASLTVGLLGKDVQSAADAIAGCGAARTLGVSGDDFAQARYGTDAAAVEALVRAASANVVICGGSSRFNRVLPGVGHRLGGTADLHATGVTTEGDALCVTRWYYRQRMKALVKKAAQPWLIAIDSGFYEMYAGAPGSATVEALSVGTAGRTTVVGFEAPPADEQTIRPDSELLFVAGAGWTKKQANGETQIRRAEKIILETLKKSQGSLGSSKSLVDVSAEGQDVLAFMTHLNQVGQTGATPRHAKGLATCCHGEEPHVVGWRFVNERRAINTDAACGWAQGKTDVLYVADAFELMEKVNELL